MFQSLGRDSGCSSRPSAARTRGRPQVSIPRSGFWVFKLGYVVEFLEVELCFNPSVGILGVQALASTLQSAVPTAFQSLGRDSGCSSAQELRQIKEILAVSIPRSGFWVFKREWRPNQGRRPAVSIPRSGFWVFKHVKKHSVLLSVLSFNPSVGILGVQASPPPPVSSPMPCFNPSVGILGVQACRSPVRRLCLACFNPSVGILGVQATNEEKKPQQHPQVSIPRSGFWVFKQPCSACAPYSETVSIPRSGFWVFKPPRRQDAGKKARRFNPSVGILGVQAPPKTPRPPNTQPFQSLGRDSGCSSPPPPMRRSSTPEFQSLGRDSGCSS